MFLLMQRVEKEFPSTLLYTLGCLVLLFIVPDYIHSGHKDDPQGELQHAGKGRKVVNCPVPNCTFSSFKGQSILIAHFGAMHTLEHERPYCCLVRNCGRKFSYDQAIAYHAQTAHGWMRDQQKLWECDQSLKDKLRDRLDCLQRSAKRQHVVEDVRGLDELAEGVSRSSWIRSLECNGVEQDAEPSFGVIDQEGSSSLEVGRVPCNAKRSRGDRVAELLFAAEILSVDRVVALLRAANTLAYTSGADRPMNVLYVVAQDSQREYSV